MNYLIFLLSFFISFHLNHSFSLISTLKFTSLTSLSVDSSFSSRSLSQYDNKLKRKQQEFKQNRSPKKFSSSSSTSSHNRNPSRTSSYNRYQDAWWMKGSEENNPRVLPKYSPWWQTANFNVTSSWSIEFLIREAKRRGIIFENEQDFIQLSQENSSKSQEIDKKMNLNEAKELLIKKINNIGQLYKLDDNSFTKPSVLHLEDDVYSYSCFPHNYQNNQKKS